MGTVETQSKAPCGVSSPLAENAKDQGSELEKNEVREALGTLTSGEGCCKVAENGVGVGVSSVGDQGLCGDGVVQVVESSVVETKVSVLRDNDCQVLADSEMNNKVSSLLKTRESDKSTGCEELDCGGKVEEAAVLSGDGLVRVDGEDTRDGKESDEEKKDENYDGKIVTVEVPIVEKSENMDVEVEDLEKKDENCDWKIVTVDVPIAERRENMDVEVEDLEKKDEICDGKIVTVEVPIVETSEIMDVEVKDLSDERHGYSVGDYVWGKIKSHPWWPGRVYDPSDASGFALKLKQRDRHLVAYFGDGTFAWCHPAQLKPFEDNFDAMVRQSSSKAFTYAVQEAVNEVGRLLNMKMSCSFVARETTPEFALPLAKNSGIKEGVLVPESGVERLSAVPIEPAELLSQVKQIAKTVDIASILELEILKARLSAFYLSRGGFKLPNYEDPKPVLGLEESRTDEAVDAGNRKSAVEAPVQGPSGELCHSSGLSGRKQKSIAEIMGEDQDIHTKNREADATDEVVDTIGSSSRKKTKGSEDAINAMASKPVRKRKELLLITDRNVARAENEGRGVKENSDKETLLQSNKKRKAFGNENISSGSKKETDEGKSREQQNEMGSSPRERKKSKYLSPPFTTSSREVMKGNIETKARNDGRLSPQLSDSSNHQTQVDEKKTIDPATLQVSSGEILSKVRNAAISPQIPREGTSLDRSVDFIFVLRSSLYREGSLYKVYNKSQPGRKRKKPESQLGTLRKDQNKANHISPNEDSEPTKRRKETTPSMPKEKRAPETKTGKKGVDEKTSEAVLFVSFWPGSTLPSKSDLITIFSKFGALNEAETDMFRTNYTARVSFLRTCDAEKALNDSQDKNPFKSADVTYELQYVSAGSKSGGHSERSKSKPSQGKNKGKTPPTTASVLVSQGSEASKLNLIKHKLQGLASMLESSDGKSPDFKTKVESKVKGLLEDVNKMVESTSS